MAKSKAPTQLQNSQEIIRITDGYFKEAEEARRDRILKNRLNWDVYYGKMDWSYKQIGQSTEHLPKLAGAVEQMVAFVKRALTGYGDWFSVDVPANYPLQPEQVRALLRRFLDRVMVARNQYAPIHTIIANAVKQGLLESLIVLKVHGGNHGERVFKFEPGDPLVAMPPKLVTQDTYMWRLRIDLIPTEDYYPDPTGRNLYKIHEVERDYFDVLEAAEKGLYDIEEVKKADDDFSKDTSKDRREARQRNQNETTNPRTRRRVVLRECWGTILGEDGRVKHKDVVWTIMNGKYLIRKPEPYPFWHGEDPFVEGAVIQNPHSVWSKAMYDDVASLNIALDELYNLILDGGIASVWGVRQVRTDWLEDPRQISGGIPQNATLAVNENAPIDGKVVEVVSTGKVPPEAIAVLNLTDREHAAAAWTNDIRLGNFPERATKATEVMAAEQNSSVMVDSFASELERLVIVPLLRKSWFNILQFADDIPAEDVVSAIGVQAAFALSSMHEAERYAALARVDFRVNGLSATLTRARDFQKFMALLQASAANPLLLEAFMRNVSGDKALMTILRMLNFNPEDFKPTVEELAQMAERVENMGVLSGVVGANKGSQPAPVGDRSMTNEARSETSAGVESEAGFSND